MVNAYCTIANDGKHVEPVLVTRIVDKDGKEVYVSSTEEKQVIPYKSAFFMQQLLMGGMREPGGTSQSLWGYTDTARDTDFGGKTGTSNNHSDAWFMCVSPNLVAGAWVGGEYRSIHFRTGALGQGSRTALPICGYFIQALMKDPEFKKYHGRFHKPNDEDITSDMYTCSSYVPVKKDTTRNDSATIEEEILLDEDGNVIPHNGEGNEMPEESRPSTNSEKESAAQGQEKSEKKKKSRPHEEQIRFEDL